MNKLGERGPRLNKRQSREIGRIYRAGNIVSERSGKESENVVELVCQELKQTGLMEEFWHIPSHSALDLRGIDFVCLTSRGFFLINVKKSNSGVANFEQRRERLQQEAHGRELLMIYPLRATLLVSKRHEVEDNLEAILRGKPSFARDALSQEMQQELIGPTFPHLDKKPRGNHFYERKPLTTKERVDQMRTDGSLKILYFEKTTVWEVRFTADVNGSIVEAVGHGRSNKIAEEEACNNLLTTIKGRVS